MATLHVVAFHITKLLASFRQTLQFRFRENQHRMLMLPIKSGKKAVDVCMHAVPIIPPLTCNCAIKQPHAIWVSAVLLSTNKNVNDAVHKAIIMDKTMHKVSSPTVNK